MYTATLKVDNWEERQRHMELGSKTQCSMRGLKEKYPMSSRKFTIAFDVGQDWRRRPWKLSAIMAGGEGWRIKALHERGQLEGEVGVCWVGERSGQR